jgi:ABC-2 type transport system ATP-binding protein
MNDNAIEIRGLKKNFGRFQLGPLDLTVPQGAIYGLIGPNAAGKTTTLDLLMGMGDADAGSITVLGLDHRRDEVAMKRQVGYASPETDYRSWVNVRMLIRFVRGFYPSWDEPYCQQLLKDFRVNPADSISTLSLGTRIKIGLILALAWHPKVLILDEPTAGLDAVSKKQIFAELFAAMNQEKRTVIISSHALSDLERYADSIGMIKDGRLLLEGATDEIVERYKMVDFVAENETVLARREGICLQKQEGDHFRALVDIQRNGLELLAARGARQILATPVTLEDIFVALAGEANP